MNSLDEFLGNVELFHEVGMLLADPVGVLCDSQSTTKTPHNPSCDINTVSVIERSNHCRSRSSSPDSTALNNNGGSTTPSVTADCCKILNPLQNIVEEEGEVPQSPHSVRVGVDQLACSAFSSSEDEESLSKSKIKIGFPVSIRTTKKRRASASSPPMLVTESSKSPETEHEMLERR